MPEACRQDKVCRNAGGHSILRTLQWVRAPAATVSFFFLGIPAKPRTVCWAPIFSMLPPHADFRKVIDNMILRAPSGNLTLSSAEPDKVAQGLLKQ